MAIPVNQRKYVGIPRKLVDRFFAFAHEAEIRELTKGGFPREYLCMGDPAHPPLLFFAGGVRHPVFSFAVIEAFAPSRRIIAPVQPVCGSLAEFFRGVDAILAQEGVRRFAAAGSSWGGQLAQVAALRYGNRVERLVLANTGVACSCAHALLLELRRSLAAHRPAERVLAEFRQRTLKVLDTSPAAGVFWTTLFADLFRTYMTVGEYLTMLDMQIDYIRCYAARVREQGFGGPVLILESDDDTVCSARTRRELHRAYPHATTHRFRAGGHYPALLHPNEYRQTVEEFLGTATQPPARPAGPVRVARR